MIPINKKAPVKVEKSIKIYSSVDKVWKIFTDINKWRLWNPDIKRATLNGNLLPRTTLEWESGGRKVNNEYVFCIVSRCNTCWRKPHSY